MKYAKLRYYYFNISTVEGEAKYAKMKDDIRNSLGLLRPVRHEAFYRFDHKLTTVDTVEIRITSTNCTGVTFESDGTQYTNWTEWFSLNKNLKFGYYLESINERNN